MVTYREKDRMVTERRKRAGLLQTEKRMQKKGASIKREGYGSETEGREQDGNGKTVKKKHCRSL
jgi:hypothetical protein